MGAGLDRGPRRGARARRAEAGGRAGRERRRAERVRQLRGRGGRYAAAFRLSAALRAGGSGCVRVLGLDPGLQHTGWGVIECGRDGRLSYVASGVVSTVAAEALAERLCALHRGLASLFCSWSPDEAAVEHTYMNKNAGAALKLGQARGVVL